MRKSNNKIDNLEYLYFTNKKELKKLITIKPNLKYLPCFISGSSLELGSNSIDLEELIGNNILLCLKIPNQINGYLKITNIITRESNNYDYCIDNPLDKNESHIQTNTKLFDDLIRKYSIVNIPGLFFFEFDKLNIYDYVINLKEFNNFNRQKNFDFYELIYPKKIKEKDIVTINYLNLFDNLTTFVENQRENDIINLDDYQKNNKLSNESDTLDNLIKLSIPILWNSCDIIKTKINDLKITKKILINHYNNCESCEKVDNNQKQICWDKKKIIIKELSNNESIIFDDVINSYQHAENFVINDIEFFKKSELNEDNINIIKCPTSSNIYSKCIFIIQK